MDSPEVRPTTDRSVARTLCSATEEVLWLLYEDRVLRASPRARLWTRVGDGHATYHQQRGEQHTITFGWRMVYSKLSGRDSAARWRTAKEILGRGFFSGRFEPLELLAQTVLHEFAHLVQTVEGGRAFGSVHNAAFYAVLSQIHRDGAADLVSDFVREACRRQGVELAWRSASKETGPILKPAANEPGVFARGDRVAFRYRGEFVEGRVRRVNRRTLTIVPDDSPGHYFRVPPALLSCR